MWNHFSNLMGYKPILLLYVKWPTEKQATVTTHSAPNSPEQKNDTSEYTQAIMHGLNANNAEQKTQKSFFVAPRIIHIPLSKISLV